MNYKVHKSIKQQIVMNTCLNNYNFNILQVINEGTTFT